jgi:N-acyl-phosphatidylethanolamine-hydrolysing phospholipase D
MPDPVRAQPSSALTPRTPPRAPADVRPSHHRPGGGFQNPWPGGAPSSFGAFVRWMLTERGFKELAREPDEALFPRATPAPARPRAAADDLVLTWVGHSTVLLQLAGLNVLTDPVWSERASPLPFAGPRRWTAPGIALDALPPIDLVLLSHSHYDHLDGRTVRHLAARSPESLWLVPLRLERFVRARGGRNVCQLDWHQTADVGRMTVACTPAQHFSGRGLGDRNRTLWCSWSIAAKGRPVFFAGDTGYHPAIAENGER